MILEQNDTKYVNFSKACTFLNKNKVSGARKYAKLGLGSITYKNKKYVTFENFDTFINTFRSKPLLLNELYKNIGFDKCIDYKVCNIQAKDTNIRNKSINIQNIQSKSIEVSKNTQIESITHTYNPDTSIRNKNIGMRIENTLKSKSMLYVLLIILVFVETFYHASLLDRVMLKYNWYQAFGTASLLMITVLIFTTNSKTIDKNFENGLGLFAVYNWFMTTSSFLYQDMPTDVFGWLIKIIVPIAIAGSIYMFSSLLKN